MSPAVKAHNQFYVSGNANFQSILIQYQLMQSDSSQQGCWKLHCLPFGTEGNDSELGKNSLYVNIMLCGLCVVLTFPQLCDILCNYARLQIVMEELCSFFATFVQTP